MDEPMHDERMTTFLVFVVAVLAVGILSLRYGVDSRIDERNRH
jgi:hypothetical protein